MYGRAVPRSDQYLENVTRVLRPTTVHMRRSTDDDLSEIMLSTVLVAHKNGDQFARILRALAPRFNVTVYPH